MLAVVGVLVLALLVGSVVVIRSLIRTPAEAQASGGTLASAPRSTGLTPDGRVRDGATTIEAGLEAAASYMREKRYSEASTLMGTLAEQHPTDKAVRIAYAQSLLGQEKFAEAYQQYQKALALTPDPGIKPGAESAKPVQRDPTLAQLHFEAGTAANTAGLPDRAEEHYWMAQVLDAAEARYPLFLAMVQLRRGQDEAANASLIRAVRVNPDLGEAWGTLAELALKQNRLLIASQHVERARTLQPDQVRWRLVQARILNRQGEPAQAAALITSLPDSQRQDKDTLALLGESYGLLKRPSLAADMYAAASRSQPADADLAFLTAQWFDRAGDVEQAKAFARSASMLGHEEAKALLAKLTGG